MVETDYSTLKGIADELHWNEFVSLAGDEFVSCLVKRQNVKNADYLFGDERVVIELKILETEFAHTAGTLDRVANLFRNHDSGSVSDFRRDLINILKMPLQRIKKANRQIRETKNELGLTGYRGILVCINDGFRNVRPEVARGLLNDSLANEPFSSIQCLIYQTNHYVEIAESPGAVLLWAPTYSPRTDDELVEFVNNLGRKWRKYSNEVNGPFDFSGEMDDIDWRRTYVVSGTHRHERFVDPEE